MTPKETEEYLREDYIPFTVKLILAKRGFKEFYNAEKVKS